MLRRWYRRTTLLDFSTKPELRGLAMVVGALQGVATPLGLGFFLMGAAARDLMLHHAHGIAALTGTEDVDFGVMVRDWPVFACLRATWRSCSIHPASTRCSPHSDRRRTPTVRSNWHINQARIWNMRAGWWKCSAQNCNPGAERVFAKRECAASWEAMLDFLQRE